ncbi:MAG: rhodanese-like domain-containing protein [Anaerovoracaceae bacterium]|jgi:phage shock protein E
MALFSFRRKSIDDYVAEARGQKDALLLDVRNKDEYAAGHIEGSVNIPLADLQFSVGKLGGDLDRPIYVYCLSGARADTATRILSQMGYTKAVSIGGIKSWKGDIVR